MQSHVGLEQRRPAFADTHHLLRKITDKRVRHGKRNAAFNRSRRRQLKEGCRAQAECGNHRQQPPDAKLVLHHPNDKDNGIGWPRQQGKIMKGQVKPRYGRQSCQEKAAAKPFLRSRGKKQQEQFRRQKSAAPRIDLRHSRQPPEHVGRTKQDRRHRSYESSPLGQMEKHQCPDICQRNGRTEGADRRYADNWIAKKRRDPRRKSTQRNIGRMRECDAESDHVLGPPAEIQCAKLKAAGILPGKSRLERQQIHCQRQQEHHGPTSHQELMMSAIKTTSSLPSSLLRPWPEPSGVQVTSPALIVRLTPLSS